MNWIYLSPHLDDVALSCGGLVWEQTRAGNIVSVWTLCAGDPPEGPLSPFAESLHTRWKTGQKTIEQRRSEDIASCTHIGATYRHFSIPDCIYRYIGGEGQGEGPETPTFLYASEESLFNPIHPAEADLIHRLCEDLAQSLPLEAELVCPLTLGRHVDHRLTRAAAERLGKALWYYADYPYVLREPDYAEQLQQAGWELVLTPVSQAGLKAWQQAVAAHASQISTFWPNLAAMQTAIRSYVDQIGGVALWRPG